MRPYIQAENISKHYGDQILFEQISFTVFEGEKVALIARNGAGKSTLLNLLTGRDTPDSGLITRTNDVKIGYFEQSPQLDSGLSVLDEIFNTDDEKLKTVREFEHAVARNDQHKIIEISAKMDLLGAWDAETEARQILTQLKITDLEQPVGQLSGGQQKRLALAKVLVQKPDFLILDEPTNHLDLEMVEWLEIFLSKSFTTVLLVTHDRFFLDQVCDHIIEMEDNRIYQYAGNYEVFLKKREERLEIQQAMTARAQNLLRTELEWMRRMPKARSHKAKYRVDAFQELKNEASQKFEEKNLALNVKSSRLGKKIVEIENLSWSYSGEPLINNFSYNFSRFEKAGIIGKNGTGKSTLLNLITGRLIPESGKIEIGSTIRFGYYHQDGIRFDPKERVIDAVNKIAEYIYFDDGTQMSASQMLTQFLFAPEMHYQFIEKLSGGEQRRLYLCTVLMQNPNFLILDEPTNDLDLFTLNVLESYLANFGGCVLVVSHDRYFMDRIVDHIFVFEGNGVISDFPGSYSSYRKQCDEQIKTGNALKSESRKSDIDPARTKKPDKETKSSEQRKLTFKERRELEQLEEEITALERQIERLETGLNSGALNHEELFLNSNELTRIKKRLDEKELRWLELGECC